MILRACFIGFFLILIPFTSLYGGDFKFSSSQTKTSKIGFNSEIWQPKNFNSDLGSSINAKISCSNIQVDFDVNAMTDKLSDILHAIIGNPQVLAVNTTIKGVARIWAIKQCGGGMEQILKEYPEQAQKLIACVQEGMGDSMSLSSGAAVGTANFVEIETESNPGVFSRISGCITGELGEEYGDGYRRCVDRESIQNVETIRDILDWALQFDYQNNLEAQQSCILDEQAKEEDFVKASKTYGESLLPDGTQYKCEGESCKAEKVSWADFALTQDQDSEIKDYILTFIEEYSNKSALPLSKKEMIYTFILNWYEAFFINSNSWNTNRECSELIHISDPSLVINNKTDSSRLTQFSPESQKLFSLLSHDPASLMETVKIMKESCKSYMAMIREQMFLTSAQKTLPALNSKVQRKTYELGFIKSDMDMTLLNMADESRNINEQAKEEQRKREKKKFMESINRAIEKVKKKK